MLDGEGGYTVWGKLMPAAASLKAGALPIGLAHRVKLKNDVAYGAVVRWSDVEFDAVTTSSSRARRWKRHSADDVAGPSFEGFHDAGYARAEVDAGKKKAPEHAPGP